MNKQARLHRNRLDYLVDHLNIIGENIRELKLVLREPVYRDKARRDLLPMPDIIAVRYDESALIAELKHSDRHRDHAVIQLMFGCVFAQEELGISKFNKLMVIYNEKGGYHPVSI